MTGSLGSRLAGCAFTALTALVVNSTACAATGHITFSGAVIEPTCSAERVPIGSSAYPTAVLSNGRRNCGRTAVATGRWYSQVVTNLASADLKHDSLLAYFASYARASETSTVAAKVVVHTYD